MNEMYSKESNIIPIEIPEKPNIIPYNDNNTIQT